MQVGQDGGDPSVRRQWHRFLSVAALWLGICLVASGAVCWVAANWSGLGKFQRLAGAQALVAVAAVGAALALRRRPSAVAGPALLALAAAALGALLALVGQTYQTGADTWQLFAWWALLMLPWALAAYHWGVWLLWALVFNVAVGLALGERVLPGWGMFFGQGWGAVVQGLLNTGLLALWETAGRRLAAERRWGPRALVAAVAALLACAVIFADAPVGGLAGPAGLAWAALTLALGLYYLYGRRDPLALALLAAAAMAVSLRVAAEWLVRVGAGVWAVLPLAAMLMIESALAVRGLRALARPPSQAGPAPDPVAAGSSAARNAAPLPPWYTQALLGVAAWVGTVLLLVFVAASGLVSTERQALACGLVLCAAAIVLARAGAPGLFRLQCAAAAGFAGQLLFLYGVFSQAGVAAAGPGALALAGAVYVLSRERVLRFLSAWVMAAALTLWIGSPGTAGVGWLPAFDAVSAFVSWLPAMVLLAWTGAAVFLAAGPAPRAACALHPLAWAFVLAAQAGAWQAAGASLRTLPDLWALHPAAAVLAVAAGGLPVGAAWAVCWPRRQVLGLGLVIGLPSALAVLAVFWLPSPGVAFALAWIVLGYGLGRAGLLRFGALALLAYLAGYYYQQAVPLLEKALWLCAAGAVLLACGALVRLWRPVARPEQAAAGTPGMAAGPGAGPVTESGQTESGWRAAQETTQGKAASAASRRRPWRPALAYAGLALALACANAATWRYETVLRTGRTVLLELAPVDPRSLMQGDYMALRFAVAGELVDLMKRNAADCGAARNCGSGNGDSTASGPPPHGDGYLILVPDARGVARLVRIQPDPQPRSAAEIALRYRVRDGQARIVTNAFFFPEGQARRYQAARFGALRVDDTGTGLLTTLLDGDLDPL